MKALLQRVTAASVCVDGKCIGSIGAGMLVLLGVGPDDQEKEADFLVEKLVNLRIFTDENDKMNLSLLDTVGELLIISQFTLYADCRKGRRPSFTQAAPPQEANRLYEYAIEKAKQQGVKKVEHGSFGADMKIELCNDGPVTIMLDTDQLPVPK